ncbi:polyamine aminopropyltransferase [candidate division KSB1 bacterium]|nr:polyamine aminopropyltransferase [candidate division KSB1 bacterium]
METKKERARKSIILKICLFATGLAGIVAEFVLSTLASYLLGNSIFQWSLIISLMLFAMGVGSYITKFLKTHLLDKFIFTEFLLSILCALSAAWTYGIAAYTTTTDFSIYTFSFFIGLLIGLEIPLVTRINQQYQTLRVNISAVMQYDYLGALVGGLLFSFFALPLLGLTYTPIALSAVNFFVASILLWKFRHLLHHKRAIYTAFSGIVIFLILLSIFIRPIILFSEQRQYRDKIIYQTQTLYQKIVITQWKQDYWLFINRNLQFSTYDEERYHEPLVHPALMLTPYRQNILILGGGDGLAVREVLKYPDVEKIVLVDIDPEMTRLSRSYFVFLDVNAGSMNDPRVQIVNMDAFQFLKEDTLLYDAIIVDLPDPNTVELAKLYSTNFYALAKQHLAKYGAIVTQSCDVLMATKAFCCINKTMEHAGLTVVPYHNYVPTMGDWGWNLGVKSETMNDEILRKKFNKIALDAISTKFLNQPALTAMFAFGKGVFEQKRAVDINTEMHPVLHTYYMSAYEVSLN